MLFDDEHDIGTVLRSKGSDNSLKKILGLIQSELEGIRNDKLNNSSSGASR